MDRGFKWLVARPWFWALGVVILFSLPLVRTLMAKPPALPEIMGQLGDFRLVRENGNSFGSRELTGKVWVAQFFSPAENPSRATMESLERRMRKLGDAFFLVSFTVKPETDTVERLAVYAREHQS